jgi:ornithine cyclodeaminase
VVEDVATALREAGDVVLAIAKGAIAADGLVTIADIVTGRAVVDPARPSVYKSVGMAWQDLVVAGEVQRRLSAAQQT